MPAPPMCPRCGYDLSGLVASWTNACPLEATCAECGLEFSCANALSERLLGPGWSYEHALTSRSDRFWGTSRVTIRPRRLCSTLRVDHRVMPRRVIGFALLWLLVGHIVVVAATLAGWLVEASAVARPATFANGARLLAAKLRAEGDVAFKLALFPYLPPAPPAPLHGELPPAVVSLLLLLYVPTFLMPAWLTILGDTLSAAHIRRIHLLCGLAYSIPGSISLLIAASLLVLVLLQLGPVTGQAMVGAVVRCTVIGFPVYHGIWWFLYIRRHLRLRRAPFLVALLMAPSGLVIAILALWLENLGLVR